MFGIGCGWNRLCRSQLAGLGSIIMPFLSYNDHGTQVLPPFVLEINWATLAITYGFMIFVFTLIILGMIRFIRRISMQRILRLGEL